nr:Atu4866 domain-containing protein [Rhizobium laguerreae]
MGRRARDHSVFSRQDGAGAMTSAMLTHPYGGMWQTTDGRIRHQLLPNGRYDEARGSRESAYQGRYEVSGNHIEYWDDTGFTADGDFVDDVLHHAGMVLYRKR